MNETRRDSGSESTPDSGAAPGAAPGTAPGAGGDGAQRAPLSRPWLLKVTIMAAVVAAMGGWFLYDALVAYPNRGERYAEFARYQYLEAAQAADREESPGLFRASQLTVENPRAELERLSDPETREKNRADADQSSTSPRQYRARFEEARRDWLKALATIGELEPARTSFESPREELAALEEKWTTTTSRPAPLASYDIPSQWVVAGVCIVLLVYLLVLIVSVARRKYVWEPGAMRLTLPCGARITPDDLEEVDKRKWDKFIVFLRLKPDHPTLGGRTIKFDTYRHARLEEWLLDMEAAAFPAEQEMAEAGGDAGEPSPSGHASSDAGASGSSGGSSVGSSGGETDRS